MNANVQFLADQKPGRGGSRRAGADHRGTQRTARRKLCSWLQNDKAVARDVKVLATHSDGYVVDEPERRRDGDCGTCRLS